MSYEATTILETTNYKLSLINNQIGLANRTFFEYPSVTSTYALEEKIGPRGLFIFKNNSKRGYTKTESELNGEIDGLNSTRCGWKV